jgi:hypothetical protein
VVDGLNNGHLGGTPFRLAHRGHPERWVSAEGRLFSLEKRGS